MLVFKSHLAVLASCNLYEEYYQRGTREFSTTAREQARRACGAGGQATKTPSGQARDVALPRTGESHGTHYQDVIRSNTFGVTMLYSHSFPRFPLHSNLGFSAKQPPNGGYPLP